MCSFTDSNSVQKTFTVSVKVSLTCPILKYFCLVLFYSSATLFLRENCCTPCSTSLDSCTLRLLRFPIVKHKRLSNFKPEVLTFVDRDFHKKAVTSRGSLSHFKCF